MENTHSKRHAFSLIELTIVIAVIGILAALLTINLSQSQKNARNSKRKEDVRALTSALNSYHLTHENYFITYNNQDCGPVKSADLSDYDASYAGTGCVGANGRGYGKMNLKIGADGKGGVTAGWMPPEASDGPAFAPRQYTSHSIIESLQQYGLLTTKEQVDPLNTNVTDASQPDYVLVRCCLNGVQSINKNGGAFAIWTKLETTIGGTQEEDSTSHFCGGVNGKPDIAVVQQYPGHSTQTGYFYDFAANTGQYPAGFSFALGNTPTNTRLSEANGNRCDVALDR